MPHLSRLIICGFLAARVQRCPVSLLFQPAACGWVFEVIGQGLVGSKEVRRRPQSGWVLLPGDGALRWGVQAKGDTRGTGDYCAWNGSFREVRVGPSFRVVLPQLTALFRFRLLPSFG